MADWPLSGDGQYFKTYGMILSTSNAVQSSGSGSQAVPGTWVEVTKIAGVSTPLEFEAAGFIYTAVANGGASVAQVVDIGIGATFITVTTIIQGIYLDFGGTSPRGGQQIHFPIGIAAGSKIWVRNVANTTSSVTVTHTITPYGFGFRPSRLLSKCTTYNMDGGVADAEVMFCQAIAVQYSDPGGASSATKVFTDITIITSAVPLLYPIAAALFCIVPGTSDALEITARWFVDIGIGPVIGSPNAIVLSDIAVQGSNSNDRMSQSYFGPVPLSLPAGTVVQAGCNISVAQTVLRRRLGIVMYAFS